jgi:glycosyltransferase involved in cell wall biosynthesis
MKKLAFIFNLDTVKNKNHYQFNAMHKFGYKYYVFGYSPDISTDTSDAYQYQVYEKNLLKRFLTVLYSLMKHRKFIHHIELYTGSGNFLLIEFLLAKLLGLPVCIVERGSPLKDLDICYGPVGRLIRKLIYRKSNHVWIRELWMKQKLATLGRDNYFFLANCVEIPKEYFICHEKDIEFFWCNSLKKWRNPDWFIDALRNENISKKKSVLIGLLKNKTLNDIENYIIENKPDNLEIYPFQDPKEFYLRSRFFILPADIVFLNFSLLEAMSFGVVPIISDVDGAREIVTDGVDGFVIDHDKRSLEQAMINASKISGEEYKILSENAKKKVVDKYSITAWSSVLNDFYEEISNN